LSFSRAFGLPGKKRLKTTEHQIEIVVIDVTETPIERPKKTEKVLQWQEKATYTLFHKFSLTK
jgi:hypothetical protein